MDNHFPSDDHFHPHLPNHGIPSDQHALYRIPSSQSMGPAASPGQATSLYPAPVMQQRRPSMEQDMYASSCIPPSCLPPGTDPTSVDFRTFYPYVPNEVKHRRRTSRQQLKVLEATFKDQTKPNGVLRKRLAQELHMTPRSVQVWFQNRRAKEKTLANKKSDAKGNKGKPDNSPIPEDMPSPSHSSASDLRTMSERTESPEIVEVKGPVSAPEMSSPEPASESPAARPIAPRLPLQSHSSPAFSTIPENSGSIHCRHPMLSDNELQNFRRGSLPTIVYRNLPGPSDESLAKRRSSVDVSLARLAKHPYARLALAANQGIYGEPTPFLRPSSRLAPQVPEEKPDAPLFTDPWMQQRPALHHRASMPHALNSQGYDVNVLYRRSSFAPPVPECRGEPPFLMQGLPMNAPPHFPPRDLPPGPLPPADYSFGQARAPPISNFPPDYNESTDLKAYSFPSSARKEGDSVDDSSSSYDQSISPRGSISSVADSESSVTSAWYSDVGSVGCGSVEYPHGFHPDSRRESCASGILVAFSGLDVGGSPSAATFSPPDGQAVDASASPHQPDQDSAGESTYPSPGSTISPGGSPRMEEPAQSIPISTSSELAHAFAVKQEETHTSGSDGGFMNSSLGTGMVAEDTKVGPAGGAVYGQAEPSYGSQDVQASSASSSDSSLGSYEFVPRPEKYIVDTNVGAPSMSGHYSPPMYPDADGFTVLPPHPEHYQGHGMGMHEYHPYEDGRYDTSNNYGVSQGYHHPLPECSLTGAELYAAYR